MRESLLLSVKGTRTTSRWVGIMLLSWLMRSSAIWYSSGRYWPSILARLRAFSAATSLRPRVVAFSSSDLAAVADLAGAKPARHGDELDLGNEIGHLDERGAFALAGLDALVLAGRVGETAVQKQGDIGEKLALAIPGLDAGIEDPAEGALAGSEADHGGIEPDGRLVFRGAALGG